MEPPAAPHSPAVASTTYNDGTTTDVTPDSNDTKEEEEEKCELLVTTVDKQEIAPKRVKKQPVTRGNGFLWEI